MKKDLERFLSRFAFFVIYSRVFRMKIGIEAEELSKGVKAAKRRAQISFISLSLTRSAMDEWKEVFRKEENKFLVSEPREQRYDMFVYQAPSMASVTELERRLHSSAIDNCEAEMALLSLLVAHSSRNGLSVPHTMPSAPTPKH